MAQTDAQSDRRASQNDLSKVEIMIGIKKEMDILVKPEPHECVVCVVRSQDTFDIFITKTVASGALVHSFLCKFTNTSFNDASNYSKYICKSCLDLVNVLEQAEIEYMKLKETFESIISKNPLFDCNSIQPIRLSSVKNEFIQIQISAAENNDTFDDFALDSEDEPLSLAKKKRHRKPDKRKKKGAATGKRKAKSKQPVENDSWECSECGMQGDTGGLVAQAAHKISVHSMIQDDAQSTISDVKKEDLNDSMQSFNNGFDAEPKVEMGEFDEEDDDDDSSNYIPDDEPPKPKKRVGKILKSKNSAIEKATRKRERIIHKCDQCDAKYSSLVRLEQHKLKHDGSKPPYICEVCGAHYKHKRACDIHIALHKGISDWKCEECNKLFPSKGALARHNNIHTGKLNYQCDLCGKSFIHTSSFKMHKLSHSGVKPHACDVCGLALMTRSHLKRHKRVHSGEKRHECTICGKRFSERYNLAAHSKSHESPAVVAPVQARRRLFRCTFCPDRFERRYMLERHTSVVHGRALERPPPTPRNTMSKLLKAQARRPPEPEPKDERSPEPRAAAPHKLIAQLSGGAAAGAGSGSSSWSSAYTEFNLRTDFPH